MNAILKRFVHWKKSPVDTLILALVEISASFYLEILRGRWLPLGRGDYHLRQEFAALYDLEKDCSVLPEIRKEEDIFNNIKNSLKKAFESGSF